MVTSLEKKEATMSRMALFTACSTTAPSIPPVRQVITAQASPTEKV